MRCLLLVLGVCGVAACGRDAGDGYVLTMLIAGDEGFREDCQVDLDGEPVDVRPDGYIPATVEGATAAAITAAGHVVGVTCGPRRLDLAVVARCWPTMGSTPTESEEQEWIISTGPPIAETMGCRSCRAGIDGITMCP